MTGEIDISVVIVTNNHRQYLGPCLTALTRQGGPARTEIFVVDNASKDGSAQFVRENFSGVNVLAQTVKRGLAANNNLAIRQSRGRYVLILNPDTEAEPTALRKLADFMDSQPGVGICGPQLRYPDGSLQPSCRAFPTWQSTLVRRTPLRLLTKNSPYNRRHLLLDVDHSVTQQVDWMLGACLMIRRETLEDVGLFDERYFLYVEDIDFCLRAHKRGWGVYYVPEAVITHHHLAVSDKRLLGKHMVHHLASMCHFMLKHGAGMLHLGRSAAGQQAHNRTLDTLQRDA